MSVKFQTNIPLLLHFPFGDAKETEGQYGVQHQYTVNHEHAKGQKDQLYATPTLHAHLSAVPDLRGRSMWITKKEEGTRKYFEVCYEDGTPVPEPAHGAAPAPAPAPAGPPPPPARPAGPPPPPAARPPAPASGPAVAPPRHPAPATAPAAPSGAVPGQRPVTVSVESLGELLRTCLQEALAAWHGAGLQPTTDNIQAHASLLFISARDGGLGRLPTAGGVAAPAPAPGSKPTPPTGPPPPSDADAPPDDSDLPFSLAFLIPVLGAGISAASLML